MRRNSNHSTKIFAIIRICSISLYISIFVFTATLDIDWDTPISVKPADMLILFGGALFGISHMIYSCLIVDYIKIRRRKDWGIGVGLK